MDGAATHRPCRPARRPGAARESWMSLPDLTRMAALPPSAWQVLRDRLQALGLTNALAQDMTRMGGRLPEPLRAPLRRRRLRAMDEPLAFAMRMLLFDDPVTVAEAKVALGAELCTTLT